MSRKAAPLRWPRIAGASAALLIAALAIKLIWFEPELTLELALETAEWQLEKASEEMEFDLSKFGAPDDASGNSTDGYLVSWKFHSPGNTTLNVIVLVAPLDVDFAGLPFLLDCRPGQDQEVRGAGFGYLCKDRSS